MKEIHTAIAGEHEDDIEVLIILCNKLLFPIRQRIKVNRNNRFVNKTQILPKDIPAINKFFENRGQLYPEILIIITDRDKDGYIKQRLEKAKNFIGFSFPVIFAVPNQMLENWLVSDLGAVNRALKANISEIPRNDTHFNAKEWLAKQIGEYRRDIKNDRYKGICKRIAEEINDVYKLGAGFEKFRNDFLIEVSKVRQGARQPTTLSMFKSKARRKLFKWYSKKNPLLYKELTRKS